uniref:PID domain-containing protein n=1 Tax=Meloidogyne incognita TaxID=6306 RepID=A0A914KQV3_MELIC
MGTLGGTSAASGGGGSPPTPLCRCRVLYIGCAVPTVTKDGLQGIQQPLRERYPASESPEARGIDSWLSVWYNGLLLEYVDGEKRTDSAFFAINSLHYCAAVRYVNMGGFAVEGGGERFIPLDSPFAQTDSPHPPIFAAIFRRTTGVKVLECHGFVCTNEKAANALVRCCFHAYADTMYLKLDEKMPSPGGLKSIREPPPQQIQSRSGTPSSEPNFSEQENGSGIPPPPGPSVIVEGTQEWNDRAISQKTWKRRQQSGEYDGSSLNSSLIKKGGVSGGVYSRERQQQQHEGGILVPYRENGNGVANNNFNNARRTTSHTELRPPVGQLSPADHFEQFGHRPPMPNPFMFGGPMPSPPPPPPHPGLVFIPPGLAPQPPGHFFRQPPPPMHHHSPPHFFPPRPPFPPFPPPPHFGRIAAPPPPFMMRPFFMVMPPHFMGGGGHHHPRPKSPERLGGGPIITETAYDTFPRNNRTTYEEPIYMPSTDNTVPPQASYKPGSFSPELYEHYYETYRQQRTTERKNVMSRTDSDASADYWESGVEANSFRKTRNNAGNITPKAERGQSPVGGNKKNGDGDNGTLTKTRITQQQQQPGPSTSRTELIVNGKARPDTPPADYEVGGGQRATTAH